MHLFNTSKGSLSQEKKGKKLPIMEKWASGVIYKNHRILRLCFEEQSEIKVKPKSWECTTESHSTSEHYMGFITFSMNSKTRRKALNCEVQKYPKI